MWAGGCEPWCPLNSVLAYYGRIALDPSELQGELSATQDGYEHTRLHEGPGSTLPLLLQQGMEMRLS